MNLKIIKNKKNDMKNSSKIYIAGHNGMVGSAIIRNLKSRGYDNLVFIPSLKYNLINQQIVNDFFAKEKPDYVIDAAAKVGGIMANNTYRAQFIYENMMIQNNLIHAAHEYKVKKLLFLGSSCIYPKLAPQPLKEDYLLTNSLEPTNEWYAIAKISGVKLCQAIRMQFKKDFVSLMPTNLYGPSDNFDLQTSHVLSAMIRKFHEAKENNHSKVILWGNGTPMREFLHVDDLAKACVYFMKRKTKHTLINIGSGKDYSIKHYANLILKLIIPNKKIVIKYDKSKPNGTPRKVLDVSLSKKYGWHSSMNLKGAIIKTYNSYLKEIN